MFPPPSIRIMFPPSAHLLFAMGHTAGLLLPTAFLLTSLLRQVGAVRVTMRAHSLEVLQGDSVILPCSFFTTSPLSRLNIVWTLTPFSDPTSPKQVMAYDHGQVIEDAALIGRIGFVDVPWRADLILNSTRVSDAGTYHCVVSNPPEAGGQGIGQLSLTVLAPPSLPTCLSDGDTAEGGSVILTCAVEPSVPIPVMQWDKLEPDHVLLPINMLGGRKGTVSIHNMSARNSGLYRCSVSNPLGTQNCYISLNVYSALSPSPGILQGVLLSLCMAFILLALLVLVLWLHRSARKRKWQEGEEEECYNEIRYTPTLLQRSFV